MSQEQNIKESAAVSQGDLPLLDNPQLDPADDFAWRFFKLGGLDQVKLETADELRHLGQLDPKLWVVLSCPTAGLQFDARTLELLDADKDGRVRIPDVVAAVEWTVQRLADPVSLTTRLDILPLDHIRADNEEGRRLLASAKHILRDLHKAEQGYLTQADVAETRQTSDKQLLNGDGIIPVHSDLDQAMNDFLAKVMEICGSKPDASGQPGIDAEILDKFMDLAKQYRAWLDESRSYLHDFSLGESTAPAYKLLRELEPKLDDYFARCRLVEFDERSALAVNAPETVLAELGNGPLQQNDPRLLGLPLARIEAGRSLPLRGGLNPAWAHKVEKFRQLAIVPLLGDLDSLGEKDWKKLQALLQPFAAVMDKLPDSPITNLDQAELDAVLGGGLPEKTRALFAKDAEGADDVGNMGNVERLVLYHKHLYHLLMNFVSFCDFYEQKPTTFQNGILYLDGRGCKLTLPVDNIEDHSGRAQLSYLCLAYCSCVKQGGGEKMNIVSAVSVGDADFLVSGRNGIFIDNDGAVWDATLVKLVENPISIKTAIFSPYRRFGRMITNQIEKFSQSKDDELLAKGESLAENLTGGAAVVGAPAADAASSFDISKMVGVLAAAGLALGALGTALATIASSLLKLAWWQFPLLVFGIFVIISGPSMILAWLKLRKRTLEPVLDASNWAVNSQIPIKLMLGHKLTDIAQIPLTALDRMPDPLKKPGKTRKIILIVLAACFALGCVFGVIWGRSRGWW